MTNISLLGYIPFTFVLWWFKISLFSRRHKCTQHVIYFIKLVRNDKHLLVYCNYCIVYCSVYCNYCVIIVVRNKMCVHYYKYENF